MKELLVILLGTIGRVLVLGLGLVVLRVARPGWDAPEGAVVAVGMLGWAALVATAVVAWRAYA